MILVGLMMLQGLSFLVWAFEAFRLLFDISSRARVETGQPLAGPATFLRMLAAWWRDPGAKGHRLRLVGLTVWLAALSALIATVAVPLS